MLGEFLNAVSAVVVLLMLMAVGYFMGTKGWMKAEEKKFLSKYIINIAVPCNCINGLLNNLDQSMLAQAGLMLVSAIIGVVITILLGMGLATLLRLPKNRGGVFAACPGSGGGCSWPWPPSPTPCSSGCPCQPSCSGTCASPTS